MEWAATQPCCITGRFAATTHHVRSYGSPKDDTRIIRLVPELHMKTHARRGTPCVEDGKAVFERFHGINIEYEVEKLRKRYEQFRHDIVVVIPGGTELRCECGAVVGGEDKPAHIRNRVNEPEKVTCARHCPECGPLIAGMAEALAE